MRVQFKGGEETWMPTLLRFKLMWAEKIFKMKNYNLRKKEKSIHCDIFMSKRLSFKQRDWTEMQT